MDPNPEEVPQKVVQMISEKIEINVEIQRKQRVKKTYKCKVASSQVLLSDLRKLNIDLFQDVFFKKSNSLIPTSSEQDYTIENILENQNKIILKSDDDDVVEDVKPASAPTITTVKTVAIDGSAPKQSQTVPTFIETTTKENAKLIRVKIDKPIVVETLSLLKLRQTIDTNFQSNSGAINWEIIDAVISVPEETLMTDTMFTYNELQHSAYKYGIYQGGGKISRALKISADVKASFSREKLSQKKKGTIYFHSFYSVPRLDLRVSTNNIKLEPEFKQQLLKIERSENAHQLLNELFESYGTQIPTRFVLGGKITFDDKKEVSSIEERIKSMKSFSNEVNASIQYLSGGVNGGVVSEKEKRDINISESTNTTKTILGGDPTRSNNLNDWMNSLDLPASWSIIQKDKFIPIWEIIKADDPQLYKKLFEISNKFLKSVDIISSYNKKEESFIKINGIELNTDDNTVQLKDSGKSPISNTDNIKNTQSKESGKSSIPNGIELSQIGGDGASGSGIPNTGDGASGSGGSGSGSGTQNSKTTEIKNERLIKVSIINPYNSECKLETFFYKDSLKFCKLISSNLSSNEGHYMIISSHGNIFSKLSDDAKKFLKSLDSTINRNFSFVIICKIKKGIPHLKISKTNKKSNT